MRGDEFEKAVGSFTKKIGSFASIIEGTYKLIVLSEVDDKVKMLADNLKAVIPVDQGDLKKSLKVVRTFKKGHYGKGAYYGWRVFFDGYNEDNVAFQMIANVLNYGRMAGISSSGRGYSAIKQIQFISKNLSILREIDPAIARNIKFGGWSVSDEEITINDGRKFKIATVLSIASSATSFSELKRQSVIMIEDGAEEG